jgi:tRNA(fMet)-specific endonuclease VapC
VWVLDTDHLSLLQRHHAKVVARLRAVSLGQRATTIISAEEQLRGRLAVIARTRNPADWVTAYAAFQKTLASLSPLPLLPFDDAAAAQFVQLKATVRQVGTRDLKIAAIALSVGGILVTRNRKDFGRVPGLLLEDWTQPLP